MTQQFSPVGSRFNDRNGPGSYFRQFRFTFDEEEIKHMRHGWTTWVEPGKSPWGKPTPNREGVPPPEDDDDSGKKLQLSLFPVKEAFKQTEVVSVEIRLKNIHKRPLYVDPGLGLDSNIVRICITKPNGHVVMAEPITYHFKGANGVTLHPAGSKDGPDRKSKIIDLFYGSNGFYFEAAGTYKLRASYMSGEYYVTSEDVDVIIEDVGDEALASEYMTEETGLYVSLEGSNAGRFSKIKDKIKSLYEDATHQDWVETAYLKTTNRKTSYRDGISKAGKAIKVKAESAAEEFIERTQAKLDRFKEGLKRRGEAIQYRALAFSRSKILLKVNKEGQAQEEMDAMFKVMKSHKVKDSVIEYYERKWERMREADKEKDEAAMATVYEAYQKRANQILEWQPEDEPDEDEDENEASGLGHKVIVSPFNDEHLERSSDVIALIVEKADASGDVVTTLEYVDALQRSRKYNHSVVKYAFEIAISHHSLFIRNKVRVWEQGVRAVQHRMCVEAKVCVEIDGGACVGQRCACSVTWKKMCACC